MTGRITYEHELEELNKDLREMAFMVEKAISLKSLFNSSNSCS